MRYYNSKNIEREYVVVKHNLRGINTEILGVRYRDGYGVVAKDSKEYYNLKRISLAVTDEYPLIFLKTLKCVTTPSQIKTIWGQHVYAAYINQIKEVMAKAAESDSDEPIMIEEIQSSQCEQLTAAGAQCKNDAISKSCFCKKHIAFDTRIAAKIIEAGDIDKDLRKKLIDQWILELN